MTIATVVTRGYGSGGSIKFVVTRGYSIGAAVIPPPIIPSGGGRGRKPRHQQEFDDAVLLRVAQQLAREREAKEAKRLEPKPGPVRQTEKPQATKSEGPVSLTEIGRERIAKATPPVAKVFTDPGKNPVAKAEPEVFQVLPNEEEEMHILRMFGFL